MQTLTLLIIFFFLLILCCFVYGKFNNNYNKFPVMIEGKITEGRGLSSLLEYPTINLILVSSLKCGIYKANCILGDAIVFIDKTERFAEVHILKFNEKIEKGKLKLKILERIEGDKGIIGQFN